MPRISMAVKPVLNRMSMMMNQNQIPSLSNINGSKILANGQKVVSVKDFMKFAKNNDFGITEENALDIADEFQVQPINGFNFSTADRMIDVGKLENAIRN